MPIEGPAEPIEGGICYVKSYLRKLAKIAFKAIGLLGLSLAFAYLPPILWGLWEIRLIHDLEGQLAQVPPDQACLILEEFSEMGANGAPALVRALAHPDDTISSHAYRLLWRKLHSRETQATSEQEALVIAEELHRTSPFIPASRQEHLAALLDQLLKWEDGGKNGFKIVKLSESLLGRKLVDNRPVAEEGKAAPGPNTAESANGATVLRNSPPTMLQISGDPLPLRETGPNAEATASAVSPITEGMNTDHSSPAVVDSWQVSTSDLAAWREVFGGPLAQLAIYEKEVSTSEGTSRSFGPGSMATYLAPQGTQDGGWKSVTREITPDRNETSAGPTLDESSSRPSSGKPSDQPPRSISNRPDTTSAEKGATWATLAPLFAQLSGSPAEADRALQTLISLGITRPTIEVGRMAFHPDSARRRQAIHLLWNLPGVDPLPFLLGLAQDSDPIVRREALAVLATTTNPAIHSFVRDAIGRDSDPQVRALLDKIDSTYRAVSTTTTHQNTAEER